MKTIPAMYCEHANEVPQTCPCPRNCYCKKHTCKRKSPAAPSVRRNYKTTWATGKKLTEPKDLAQEFEIAGNAILALSWHIGGDHPAFKSYHPKVVERCIYEVTQALNQRVREIFGRIYWMSLGQKIPRKLSRIEMPPS